MFIYIFFLYFKTTQTNDHLFLNNLSYIILISKINVLIITTSWMVNIYNLILLFNFIIFNIIIISMYQKYIDKF